MADDGLGNDNNTCVVCFKTVTFFSIGECDHPVCYECSARMRVLCLQNECPICRQALSRVSFTDTVIPYSELRKHVFTERMFERQYKIGFCTEEIKQAYEKLLENRCRYCEKMPPFRSFGALSDHMKKVHERFYCDLCVKHLKIFTSERKCYTRQELAHHRRKGDVDDTSHRGHPLCEFCEERFMDADELYRHLRKEHLYCHLCDADGRNYYYASHTELAQHFRADHYLCEEGECAGDHLTSVFRSEIDLKAHKAIAHGKGLARAASRQARTLELQFNITPHPTTQQRQQREQQRQIEPLVPQQVHQVAAPRIDTRSDQDFPRLSAAPPATLLLAAPDTKSYSRGSAGLMRNDRNFPALGDAGSSSAKPAPAPVKQTPVSGILHRNSKPSMSIHLQSQPASASNFRLTQPTGNRISVPPPQKKTVICDDDFPSLGFAKDDNPSLGAATPQPPKVTLINSNEMEALKKNKSHQQKKKPQLTSEAFPALSRAAAPAATPQWIKVSKTKENQKQTKSEPPPQPSEANFNAVADFPALPINVTKNKQKKKSPPAPQTITNIVEQPINDKKQSKKDKKKQNNDNKKENINSHSNNANEKKNNRDSNSVLANVNNNGNGDEQIKSSDDKSAKINGSIPPGFTKRPEFDGMTFTNSSGQTFSAPVHSFIPPPDFEKRNMVLVEKFYKVLGDDAFETFKVASRAYRDNILCAKEFYQHCQMVLKSQMDSLFPELIALLPDIAKQQELVLGQKIVSLLKVCSTCGQLLVPDDSAAHERAHWPALGSR